MCPGTGAYSSFSEPRNRRRPYPKGTPGHVGAFYASSGRRCSTDALRTTLVAGEREVAAAPQTWSACKAPSANVLPFRAS